MLLQHQDLAEDVLDGPLTCLFKPSHLHSTLPAPSGLNTSGPATSGPATSGNATSIQFLTMPDVNIEAPPLKRSSRSKNNSQSDEGPSFVIGAVVFAHKGHSVPYWRSGVVIKIKAKAYTVRFFGDLKELECAKSNIMAFEDYAVRKSRAKGGSKLFTIPDASSEFFHLCVKDAEKKLAQTNNK